LKLTANLILCSLLASSIIAQEETPPFSDADVIGLERVIEMPFTDSERELMRNSLMNQLEAYRELRTHAPSNEVAPMLEFLAQPHANRFGHSQPGPVFSHHVAGAVPENLEELAFASIGELAALIKAQRITSVQLTQMYLARLKKYGPKLECVVELTEERALEAARKADAEIASGLYRGPLHGIPYGAKDLFAVKGTKTTWGAVPYKDQVIEDTATVVEKLDQAGAVLVAKLTLGALAWGDVWFDGMTRNPWNLEQGSSGSSAGSASAVSAGLVPFALGTETWGSIISPSTRCGVTGLRPSFGRVSRAGGMTLSWSMDKVGPITRYVEDTAIVFEAIRGTDGRDLSVRDASFAYRPDINLKDVTVGYIPELFEGDQPGRDLDRATLDKLRSMGVLLKTIRLPEGPVGALSIILSAEAAAAFDELTRSGKDDQMVRQVAMAWPNVMRAAQTIPAVAYIQANRIRRQILAELEANLEGVDLYLCPSFGGNNLLLTNLTGHPAIAVPNGFTEPNQPHSITFMGRLDGEAIMLRVAKAYQDATDFHLQQPPQFAVSKPE
jgi:Asp-tRNA(Asn)/Glu-tRNA(Gln) amidotransferase A subunit family amidase